ncbi:MAG: nucleotidyltransferase domain-containing protein [Elusimicrobiota bacterium]
MTKISVKSSKLNFQQEIKKIAKQIIQNFKPEKIILFGSFAYGKPKPSSDVDLLIIKKSKKRKVERIKEILMKVESILPFEPLVYTPKELKERLDLGDYFFVTIVKKGKILYER